MSEHAHYGTHPDADLLGAFAEGALPEHERAACLEHLAGCPDCREIVFVAQAAIGEESIPEQQPAIPAPRRRRWFAPISVWAAAAAVVVLAVSVVVFSWHKESTPPPPQLMASATAPSAETPIPVQPPQEAPAPPSAPMLSAPKKALVEKPVAERKAPEPQAAPPLAVEAMKSAAPPPATPAAPPATAPLAFAAPQSAPTPLTPTFASAAASVSPLAGPATVTGTVTDPAGGAIARTQVSLTDPAAGKTFATATDSRGEYSLSGIPPGHYQLSFVSPGFKKASNAIDLQPQQIARADSALQLGSSAESISVTAESAAVNLSTAERVGVAGGGGGRGGGRGGRGGAGVPEVPLTQRASALQAASGNATLSMSAETVPILLPNKQPAVARAVSGKITLAADSNGVLFLSTNSGKTWKEVKGKWKGKVVRVMTPPDTANAVGAAGAVFQLNTDSGAVWLSKDGSRWNPAPPAR